MLRLNIDDGVPGLTKKAMALRAFKLDFCSDVLVKYRIGVRMEGD
jgi:hypothetical protein